MRKPTWLHLALTAAVFLLLGFLSAHFLYARPSQPEGVGQSSVTNTPLVSSTRSPTPDSPPAASGAPLPVTPPPNNTATRAPADISQRAPKVLVINFIPLLTTGENLVTAWGYYDPGALVQDYIDFLYSASNGSVSYTIVDTITLDTIPPKEDGYRYSEEQYLAVLSGNTQPHQPDTMDYYQILGGQDIDLCSRVNRGEIDEVWLFAGPWMGFYESRLAGPRAFNMNAPPLDLPGCERLLPIMGFNYERNLDSMVEDFTHRVEAVMTYTYGSWEQNRILHEWDLFGLSAIQSPGYDYTGCGSVHYPPNALFDYHYSNPDVVLSICDDFLNYPYLGHPLKVRQPLDCTAWDCTQLGFFHWWLSHLPHAPGTSPSGQLNDWWTYIVDPNLIPTNIIRTPTPMPVVGTFSDLFATLPYAGPAQFSFTYNGESPGYSIEISTLADMSFDVFLNFASGSGSPLTTQSPADLWGKYTCGRTLYWRVVAAGQVRSLIQAATVTCP